MRKIQIPMILLFVIIVLVQLYSNWTGNFNLEYIAKPLIMIWIAFYYLVFRAHSKVNVKIILAFFFCWIGDVLLMLAHSYEMLFYAGVGGFLIGHLFYISVFLESPDKTGKSFLSKKPVTVVPYLLYLMGILIVLLPVLEGIMKPIIALYGGVLVAMALAAVNCKGLVSKVVFYRVFWGAIFFVASDTLLAVNKFHTEFEKSGFLIMSTYIVAQVLIMSGLVAQKDKV